MSTLRVSNIEAKADASSPSVNEKVKVTNSQGDVLIHIDGSTSGITTVGINTTGSSFDIDINQNVTFAGVVTATGLDINGSGDISGPLNVSGNVGIGTDNPFNATGYKSITLAGSTGGAIAFREGATTRWEIYGDNSNGIRFYDRTNTTERLRINSVGAVTIPGQPMMQVWAVTTASKTVSGNSSTDLIPLNASNTYDPLNDLDSSTGVYTIPVTGRYLTYYGTEGKTAANTSAGSIYYNINNTGIAGQCLYYGEAYSGNSKQVILSLAAGDTIKWQLYGNNNYGYTVNAAVYGIQMIG